MKQQYLEAGEIVRTHGVRGEVKIYPWCDGPDFLCEFDTFYLDGSPMKVSSSRVQGTMLLCRFEGVDTVEQAQLLKGKTICIDRNDAAIPEDRVFIADLIGLPVFADGTQIGTLTDVLQLPANDVYVVKGKTQYMIPAVSEFLERVDPAAGEIHVRLIEGMGSDAN